MHQEHYFAVRDALFNDATEIADFDCKMFLYNWSHGEWGKLIVEPGHIVKIATLHGEIVGLIVARMASNREYFVIKIAARGEEKNKVGEALLEEARKEAKRFRCGKVFTVIPEFLVYPGPRNLGNWLIELGFAPIKPFIPDEFTIDGTLENGVRFNLAS